MARQRDCRIRNLLACGVRRDIRVRRLRGASLAQMKREIADLKTRVVPPAVDVNLNVGSATDGAKGLYSPADGGMFFGTEHSDLPVRFHDAETIIDDINARLLDHDLRGPVSPEAAETVLRSRMRASGR